MSSNGEKKITSDPDLLVSGNPAPPSVFRQIPRAILRVLRTDHELHEDSIRAAVDLPGNSVLFFYGFLDGLAELGLIRKIGTDRWRIVADEIHRKRALQRAATAVHRALASGVIVRGLCERCGSERVEAHPVDAEKPLEVTWLCETCSRLRPVERVWHEDPWELADLRRRRRETLRSRERFACFSRAVFDGDVPRRPCARCGGARAFGLRAEVAVKPPSEVSWSCWSCAHPIENSNAWERVTLCGHGKIDLEIRSVRYRFRSKWEMDFATFLETFGLTWEYEPAEFFLTGGEAYLPDFFVETPLGPCFVELHRVLDPVDGDAAKVDKLARARKELLRLGGAPLVVLDEKMVLRMQTALERVARRLVRHDTPRPRTTEAWSGVVEAWTGEHAKFVLDLFERGDFHRRPSGLGRGYVRG